MSTKTNKSFSKRLKVTKNNKILSRKPGRNHFNAKAKRTNQLNKRSLADFPLTNKEKGQFLPKS